MTYISGWLILLGLAVVIWLGVYATRKRPLPDVQSATTSGASATTSEPKKPKGDAAKGSGLLGSWSGMTRALILGVVAIVLFCWLVLGGGAAQLAIGIASWFTHVVFDPQLPNTSARQYTQTTTTVATTTTAPAGPSPEELQKQEAERQKKIEEQDNSISFDYNAPPAWIQNPPGGYYTQYTTDDDKPIIMQCSSSPEAPPADARPNEYPCAIGENGSPSMTTVNWWRPIAFCREEGTVTVRWKYKKAEIF